ncbi:MAG: hypothetical protein LUE26_00475 [Alistipes sp.]|nr:hypothetical protein [Alistipes sp.]
MTKISVIIASLKLPVTALLLVVLLGCIKEDVTHVENNGYSISFEFAIPDAGEATRGINAAQENTIDDIYVFVFETGTDKLKYWTQADILTTSGAIVSGTVNLEMVTTAGSTYKLVFLSNTAAKVQAAVTGGQIAAEMDYSAFVPLLTTDIAALLTSGPGSTFRIPMWGESGAVTISPSLDLTGGNAISMQRALARIEVAINLQPDGSVAGLTDFTLTEVMVYNVNNDGFVIPAAVNRGADGYVTAPTVPSTTSTVKVERSGADIDNGCMGSIYVPETYNNASMPDADRPFVILKGIYLGDDPANTDETFYRLDFVTTEDRDPVDLKRNHYYTFNITDVYRQGYSTLQEAIDNNPVGVSYEFFPSTATVRYKHFCYDDVGYLASVSDYVTITNHIATSSVTNTYKAEYMGNTSPVIAAYMCDANGEPVATSHFTVAPTNATTVRVRASADNSGYYPIVEYFKVYLVDNPDIYLISQVQHNIFNLSTVNIRQVYYGRSASDTAHEGTAVGYSATNPHLPNSTDYFAIKWNGSLVLPASTFRITRGQPGDSFYYQTTVTHPEGQGNINTHISANFDMPPHDSSNYQKWYIEWWNPYMNGGAGDWEFFADTFEQVGSNYRYTTALSTWAAYFAVSDLEYTFEGYVPGTGVYTGWTWTEAMGVDPVYQSLYFEFSSLSGYTPTHPTGCGAYWEVSPSDPVTGQGKWALPLSGYMYNARTYLNGGGYLGIPPGVVDISSYYMTVTNNVSTCTVGQITVGGSSSRVKSTGVGDVRVRCVRYVEK